jgi:hypothetical protein
MPLGSGAGYTRPHAGIVFNLSHEMKPLSNLSKTSHRQAIEPSLGAQAKNLAHSGTRFFGITRPFVEHRKEFFPVGNFFLQKQETSPIRVRGFLLYKKIAPHGFEPWLSPPKGGVLPLHNRAINMCRHIIRKTLKNSTTYFQKIILSAQQKPAYNDGQNEDGSFRPADGF